MSAPSFHYEFAELPLVVAPGIEAALINGRAEIEYSRDGAWQIKSVEVEGHRSLTQAQRDAGIKPWVYLPASEAIVGIISGRLEREWNDRVQSAVSEQIEIDRETAAESRAFHRMMERV